MHSLPPSHSWRYINQTYVLRLKADAPIGTKISGDMIQAPDASLVVTMEEATMEEAVLPDGYIFTCHNVP